jgi:transcriptional antiterminator RfaH
MPDTTKPAMADPTSECPWYVVHARPEQEVLAAAVLQASLELLTYVPEVLQTRRGRRRPAPLFPGYFFVQAGGMGLPTSAINRSPGVLRVVAFGATPHPLAPKVVSALHAAVERINAGGGLAQHKFQAGDIVRLCAGPLAGMEAVFVGPMTPAARVQVLLDFLGSQRTLSVAPEELEKVAVQQAVQTRRSRGRGRPIHGVGRNVR